MDRIFPRVRKHLVIRGAILIHCVVKRAEKFLPLSHLNATFMPGTQLLLGEQAGGIKSGAISTVDRGSRQFANNLKLQLTSIYLAFLTTLNSPLIIG